MTGMNEPSSTGVDADPRQLQSEIDSLRLQLDGLMQSATVAINGT